MELPINTLLEWNSEDASQPRVERVLWSVAGSGDLAVIALFDQKALPSWRISSDVEEALARGRARRLVEDPYAKLLRPDDGLSELHKKRRDEAWEIIAPIIETGLGAFQRKVRGPLVAQTSARTRRSRRMIYWYLRRYWQAGQTINALLPMFDQCGGRGKERRTRTVKLGRPDRVARAAKRALVRTRETRKTPLSCKSYLIGAKDFDNFRRGLNAIRKKDPKLNVPGIFQRIKEEYYHRGYEFNENRVPVPQLPPANEMPTLTQFRYWYGKQRMCNPVKDFVDREGVREFNLSHRPLLGDASQMAFGPGSIFQIDSTTADLYLVSALDRSRIVGRPILYLLVDVFSHLIVGFYVTLEPSSYLAATLGIKNAITDKVAYAREHGITIHEYDWPCKHMPEKLLADRGELEGRQASGLVKSLKVAVVNTAPYRADMKGIVERRFRSVDDTMIHWLDGAVLKDRERGDRDHRLDATLTLWEFRTLMIHFCVDHNRSRIEKYRLDKDMIADGVQPCPVDLWAWGIKNRSGHLRMETDPEIAHTNLLPTGDALVTKNGIRFKKLHYTCESAVREQWNVRAGQKQWKIEVHFDPRSTNAIYLRSRKGERLEQCTLTEADQRFAGLDWHEINDYFECQKDARAEHTDISQQAKADFHANVKAVVGNAKRETDAALKRRGNESKRSRIGSIKSNQRTERALDRQAEIRRLVPPEPAPGKIIGINAGDDRNIHEPAATSQKDDAYVPPPSRLDRLRAIRNSQRK